MEELMAELETLERSGVEVPADLLAELEREIARNEEANRIAKQREQEARAAKERAAKSQAMMSSMVDRYNHIRTKVTSTRANLTDAAQKLERQEKLSADLNQLRGMTEELAAKHAAAAEAREREANANSAIAAKLGGVQEGAVAAAKKVDYAGIVEHLQAKLAKQDQDEKEVESRKKAAAAEIAATVRRLEEKSATVRAKIEQIALYEESLKARQAVLLASKKEKEALIAEEMAKRKEDEALEMKRKVLDIQKKLEERKSKLKTKEKAIEHKKYEIDKAEKQRLSRERKIHHAEKKRIEDAMFDLRKKKK